MPELRHDALTGRLVLLAAARASRPFTTSTVERDRSGPDDFPFCPGHEHDTPPEIARTGSGAAGEPGWRVRVFPNLYPIVGGADAKTGSTGAHEVVVLSPNHARAFGSLSHDEAVEVMTMLRDRARAHAAAKREHVQVLINHGRTAGASIAHPHAQVVALDFVPPAVTVSIERFGDAKRDPVLTDLAEGIKAEQGVVVGDQVAAWCPSASVSPFEVRVAAIAAGARFDEAADAQVLGVAVVLRDVLAALASELGDPAYNVVVHSADTKTAAGYHWWVEVVPRVAVVAGFELGTGIYVNSVDPADAATRLRAARPRSGS